MCPKDFLSFISQYQLQSVTNAARHSFWPTFLCMDCCISFILALLNELQKFKLNCSINFWRPILFDYKKEKIESRKLWNFCVCQGVFDTFICRFTDILIMICQKIFSLSKNQLISNIFTYWSLFGYFQRTFPDISHDGC